MLYFFRFALFVFSCYTLSMLHFFCIALFHFSPFLSLFMFSLCFTFFMLHLFTFALSSCCTFLLLHSHHVAISSCCTLFMFHCHAWILLEQVPFRKSRRDCVLFICCVKVVIYKFYRQILYVTCCFDFCAQRSNFMEAKNGSREFSRPEPASHFTRGFNSHYEIRKNKQPLPCGFP